MGPGLYSEIGKKARDLLYKDYGTDQKVTITTCTSNGLTITSSGTKKNDFVLGEIQTQLKTKGFTTDIKVNSDSQLFTTITSDNFTPGFKSILRFVVPDQTGKLELQYLHEHAGISASFNFTSTPVVNFAGVFGTNAINVGADVGLDTATGKLTKYDVAFNYFNPEFVASLIMIDKGQSINASYYHFVSQLPRTSVGAELKHHFKSNKDSLVFGLQHELDPLTKVKARVNNTGTVSALIQHQWMPKSLVTLSGEVDTNAVEKSSKVGLAIALNP